MADHPTLDSAGLDDIRKNGPIVQGQISPDMSCFIEGKPARPNVITMEQIKPREFTWLWEGVLARGKLTLLTGPVGVGKSLIALDIAARLSRGGTFPGDLAPCPSGGTLLINCDDDFGDTIRSGLEAAGADLPKVCTCLTVEHGGPDSEFPTGSEPLDLRRDWQGLVRAIDRVRDCQLVVIDTVTALVTSGRAYEDKRLCNVIARLADLALRRQIAVLAVARVNKSADELFKRASRDDEGYLAAARGTWSVVRDRRSGVRALVPAQQNSRREWLAFRICYDAAHRPRLEWHDRSASRSAESIAGAAQTVTIAEAPERLEDRKSVPLLEVRKPAAQLIAAPKSADLQQQLLTRIIERGGRITAREVMQSWGGRRYKTAAQAKRALGQLVGAGLVFTRKVRPGPQGGKIMKLYEVKEVSAGPSHDGA